MHFSTEMMLTYICDYKLENLYSLIINNMTVSFTPPTTPEKEIKRYYKLQ